MPRAVNPNTGEVLFLVNDQWVPPSQVAKNDKGESAYLINNQWILPGQDYINQPAQTGTINPLLGAVGRASELAGSGIEAVARVAESAADKLESAVPLSGLSPEEIKNKRQLEPLFQFADKLKNISKDIGYSPTTKLSDLADNPLNVVPFVVERVITSSPDMAAAVVASPAYITALTNEILNERLKNDQKELKDATVGDVATAAGAAIFQGRFEKFATQRLIKGGVQGKTAGRRIGKEAAIQFGTEGIEEGVDYLGGTVGTKKGVDTKELLESMAEGAITGGGLGTGVQGVREILDRRANKEATAEQKIIEQLQQEEKIANESSKTAPPVEQGQAVPTINEAQDTAAMMAELEGKPIEQAAAPAQVDFAKDTIIQNRNRATPASIQQMNEIAANPDYDRVSFSKDFGSGAPVVTGSVQLPSNQLGKKDTVTASDGRKIPIQYAVVNAADVLPSNNADGSVNPDFLKPDYPGLIAIAGNARTAGLRAAYERNTAEDYRNKMAEDTLHGVSSEVIRNMEQPVLVRVMPKDQVTENIGDISNVATNLNLSTVEQAQNDANRFNLDDLQFDPNGDVNLSSLRGFIQLMPPSERANLIDTNGMPTRQAIDRINAAIFQKAYGDPELVRLQYQAEDAEARNIMKALSEAAPQMARLEGAGEFDVRPQLVEAAQMAINARRQGIKLDDLVKQTDITVDPLSNKILELFAEQNRSAKRMAETLRNLATAAYDESQQQGTQDIFGERPTMTREQLIERGMQPPAPELFNLTPQTLRSAEKDQQIREDMIEEFRRLKQRKAAVERRFVKGKSKKGDIFTFKTLSQAADNLKKEIEESYEPDTTPEAFMAKAALELKKGNISREVYDVIDAMFKKNPNLLDGLRLSVRTRKDNLQMRMAMGMEVGGAFSPYERIIKLYKDSEGTYNPETIRHEISHALEQMMNKAAKLKVVDAWRTALLRSERANKNNPKAQQFFDNLKEFYAQPTQENMDKTIESMPSQEYYQYVAPSEFWAVNAESLMAANLGTAWDKFKKAVRYMLEAIKNVLGIDNRYMIHRVFNQIINGERQTYSTLNNYVGNTMPLNSIHRNFEGGPAPPVSFAMPDDSKMENFIYRIQDKQIDLKRVVQAVKNITDKWNAYLKEELYHGRTAKQSKEFLLNELRPLVKAINDSKVTVKDFETYLHNRHAEERNNQIAKINPALPDGGSGIFTDDARKYLDSLSPEQKKTFERLAKMVDDMVNKTQKLLKDSGQEEQSTIDAWNKTYKSYVPLMREDLDFAQEFTGLGQGYQTRGPASKRALGSLKGVTDILANIAAQRERAIVRAEKGRVGKALFGLAILNPNPGFWLPVNPDAVTNRDALADELARLGIDPNEAMNLIEEPKVPYIDYTTGQPQVKYRVNPMLRNSDNVFAVRIDGKDRFIFFNPNDPRALRMAKAIKNLDAEQLGWVLGNTAKVTRWIASVNTQYNPVFGAYNFIRDVLGAQFNLTTTAIKGKQAEVSKNVLPALAGIYRNLRKTRDGQPVPPNEWSQLWEDFQREGGQTGYRDQFSKNREEQSVIEQEMSNLNRGNLRKGVNAVFNWLSDYNDAMENAVRLSAYKVALDQGLTKERAASLAKNLTVNFNRKGERAQQYGALYAFFNSSVQGTTRLLETLSGPKGKAIVGGGLLLGSMQAVALAMMGYDENEPPDFIKERNLVIPFPDGRYFAIPMPLGLHVIPNIGRITTEMVINGGRDAPKKVADMFGVLLDAFNPVGNAGLSFQTLSPTATDPLVAIYENKDTFGRPIAREDRATNPTPGYTRARDTASYLSKQISYFLNIASGGTKYQKGVISPTPDQIDFLVGQATGGIGRELGKVEQTVTSGFTGEELPSYKIPLVGRFYGDVNAQAAQANKFYDNITKMANYENEIKGRIENREDVQEFLRENPAARLYRQANTLENEIAKLNRRKRELLAKGADPETIKRLEDQKTRMMKQFNDRVREAESQ